MSLVLLEGFDDGLALERFAKNTGIVSTDIDATYGRNGKGLLLGDTPANYLWLSLPDITEICVGFAFNVSDVGSGGNMLRVQSATVYDVNFIEADNSIVFDHQGLADVGTGPNAFSTNTWHYFEFHTYSHDSAGFYEIKIDGSTVLSDTGLDTKYSVYFIDVVRIASGVDSVWIDDLYVLTGSSLTPLGDIEVVTLLPTGNGTSSDMLGSDANSTDNYLLVDNNAAIPPATTEYVGSGTEGDTDTYAMGDVTGTPDILGVQTSLYAEMTDTGPKSIRPVIRSGTTDYPGTTIPLLNSAYKLVDEVWENDPDTATAWTYTGVNAMEVGQEVRDS